MILTGRRTTGIRTRQNQLTFLALMAAVLLGAVFRLYLIDKNPIWLDEAFSVYMGGEPISEIVRLTITVDSHPPLYHLLLRFWTVLGGNSEAWVRSSSALMGVLTILAIYGLGETLSGRLVGLLAALILAFSPFHVQYGQEARPYALLALLACLTMWMTARLLTDHQARTEKIGSQVTAFARAWRQGQTAALHEIKTDLTWIGYILFSALTLYGHNTAIFLPFGINLFVLCLMGYRRSTPARGDQLQAPSFQNWAIAQAVVFLLWIPWLPAFFLQSQKVAGKFWLPPPTFWSVITTLRNFLMAFLPDRLGWQGLIWAGFAGAFILAFLYYRERRGHFLFLAALFLAPFLGELLVSLHRPIFYDRTLIWSTIPLYVLIAAGISQLRFRAYIFTASIILVTLGWISLHEYYTGFEKERWDLAAEYVAENAQEGDLILFNVGWAQVAFDYYFRPYNRPVAEMGIPATLFEAGELEPRMTKEDLPRLRTVLQGRDRVWLVYSRNTWTDPQALIPAVLEEELLLKDARMFHGMLVQLYADQ